jgi:hypothetical protein
MVRVERLALCSSCLSLFLKRPPFDPVFQPSSVARSLADDPPGVRGQSALGVLVADGPRCLHGRSIIVGAVLEVLESFSDSPPLPRGRSVEATRTVRQELADSPPSTAQGC